MASGLGMKTAFGMFDIPSEGKSQLLSQLLLLGMYSGMQRVLAQVLESLPTTWETWVELQAPGFGLT